MKKNRQTSNARRRLGVESLERRELLAGDVTISLSSGHLKVTGDEGDNRITIVQQANGLFNIEGLDDEVFTGPTSDLRVRNLTVNLGAGDDIVVIAADPIDSLDHPANILGTTTVNGGGGSDLATVAVVGRAIGTFVLPALAINVDMGSDTSGELQDDVVTILNSSATRVDVKTGYGNDEITIGITTALTLNVDAGAPRNFNGSTDNDFVNLGLITSLYTTINLGTGNFVPEGAIENILEIGTSLFGSLNIYGGDARDHVSMVDILAGLNLSIYTFGGADSVVMNDVQTGLTADDYADLANEIATQLA